MKYIIFVIVFISQFFFSQSNSYKVTYKINFVKDSTEQNYKFDELSYLFFNSKKSYFLSLNKYKSDSTLHSLKNNKNATITNSLNRPRYTSNFNFSIEKANDSIIFKEKIAGVGNFIYFEKNNLKNNWKIDLQELKVLGYNCKRASLTYGGRIWYAWFTNEIPVSEGPYKFSGLPGLILRIEDSKKQYYIEAIGISKTEFPENIIYKYSQEILTNREEFIKVKRNYYQNPVQASNGRMNYIDKVKEREFIERMRKNNNPIELQ